MADNGTKAGTPIDSATPDDALRQAEMVEAQESIADPVDGVMRTADGTPLKVSLRRALRREKLRALLLIAPLLIFILLTFIFPIADMLFRSVENSIVQKTLPNTVLALEEYDPGTGEAPGEETFAALADDMMRAQEEKTHTRLGSRLNYDTPGISSLFRKSGRRIKRMESDIHKEAFIALNPAWGQAEAWQALRGSTQWPAAFPRTAIAWENWEQFLLEDEGPEADPSAVAPYGFTYTQLYYDMRGWSDEQFREANSSGSAALSGLFTGLQVAVADFPQSDFKSQFTEIDKGWGEVETWAAIKQLSPTITDSYFLASVDAERTAEGIDRKPENERIYGLLFVRTILLSMAITISCILLGYPIAYLLASLPTATANLLMILVLLPFWTSLLVRTSAWKVLLQQQGVINDTLVMLGVVDNLGRLALINNMTGTIIAMTHILLPFMILPMFSVMKTISPTYVRAAISMGANDWTAFWKVYFPNTIPGIGAGSILVFILAIGYYITPELVGGTTGVFISNRIAYHISSSLNWGLAAALGSILLVLVLALYWCYDRIVGIDNVKLG